jgi:hypothetical protein
MPVHDRFLCVADDLGIDAISQKATSTDLALTSPQGSPTMSAVEGTSAVIIVGRCIRHRPDRWGGRSAPKAENRRETRMTCFRHFAGQRFGRGRR